MEIEWDGEEFVTAKMRINWCSWGEIIEVRLGLEGAAMLAPRK